MSVAVQMRGIDKAFGPVRALAGVSLSVEKGVIHALVGENGAGKTTLMRILYGALRADGGDVELDESPVNFRNPRDGAEAGVGMVSQHYSVIPQLSCLDNLMLGAERGPLIAPRPAVARAEALASRMGFEFEWRREASSLSPAGAQKLEILKLLWREAKVMILDEPTAMLSPADSQALFQSLRRMTDDGATVILVTHRLPEVIEHCEHVTVLREGRNVADCAVRDTNASQLAEWIVGHSAPSPPQRRSKPREDTALQIDGLVARGARGHAALQGLSLSLRAGEMLGIAGVDGNGQRELFQTLLGLLRPMSGSVSLFGRPAERMSSRARLAAGVRLIPEDRLGEGLVLEWSLAENAALGLQRLAPFARGPWIDERARKHKAVEAAAMFGTRHGGVHMPVASLSGGNQQRFVAGRALCLAPRLVLAFQPARGLDVDAGIRLYQALRQSCDGGAGVLIVSFDLDELLDNCDRVAVMRSGRLLEPPEGKERDRASIGELMVGAA